MNKVTSIGPALDKGLITPTMMMTVPGQLPVADRMVHDWFQHGDLQMTPTGILAISSNVGTLLINQKLGLNTFYDYLTKFGAGARLESNCPANRPASCCRRTSGAAARRATCRSGRASP